MIPSKQLILAKKPIIPPNLRPNVLAWWDARERGQVWYGLTNVINGSGDSLTGWEPAFTLSLSEGYFKCSTSTAVTAEYLLPVILGHKYYIKVTSYTENAGNNLEYYLRDGVTHVGTFKPVVTTSPAVYSGIITAMANGDRLALARSSVGTFVYFKDLFIFDLTLAFGPGNEPSKDEMDAILAADGTPYWEGTKQVLCNPDNKYYWKDISGNGRHMKLNNFAYSGASGWQSPYGLQSDGVDDYGKYSPATVISQENADLSIMCVFKLGDTIGEKDLIRCVNSATNSILLYAYGTNLTLRCYDSVSGIADISYTVSSNRWYFVVGVYSQIDKKVKLYVNSMLIGTSSALTTGIDESIDVLIATIKNLSLFTVQKIGIAAVFPGKALSPAEVRQLYEANRRRFAA